MVGFYINTMPGDIIQWSAFKSIQCQEISYSGQLLYQYNLRRYHTVVSFYINTIPGDIIEWSTFISIQCQEISYSSRLLYQYNARRYHTVVGFYINKMKTSFLFKFFIFYKLFSNHKITTKKEKLYILCIHAV